MNQRDRQLLHDYTRPLFLRPSPIDRLGKFAEKYWPVPVALFLAWVLWEVCGR